MRIFNNGTSYFFYTLDSLQYNFFIFQFNILLLFIILIQVYSNAVLFLELTLLLYPIGSKNIILRR